MENYKNQVIKKWLEIDFSFIANKLGLIKSECTVSEELIYSSIRCLDYETTVSKTPSVNYVITLLLKVLLTIFLQHLIKPTIVYQ